MLTEVVLGGEKVDPIRVPARLRLRHSTTMSGRRTVT